VVHQDVLDQPSYVQYCYQHFLYSDLNPSSLSSVSAPAPKLDKKMMPCFQHAKKNCPKKADECQYSHDRAVIKAYLFMIKLRKPSRPSTSLLAFAPPKFIPITILVPPLLIQVIVPLFSQSPTLLQFPSTMPMILPIIMTLSWSPMVLDVNWS
jgi:hypothetical protein